MAAPLNKHNLKKFIITVFKRFVGWEVHSQNTWDLMSSALATRVVKKTGISITVDIEVRFIRDKENNKCITIKWVFSSPISSYFLEETLILR